MHVHGLLSALLLTRARTRHSLWTWTSWDLVLTRVAGRHPVVILSHARHPRLSWTSGDLVLTLVAR